MSFNMRHTAMFLCLSICAGLAFWNPVTSSPVNSAGPVKHIESVGMYKSEVLDSKVPVLVDFYAEWCGPCRRQSPIVDELSKIYKDRVKFVKLDIDKVPEIAEMHSVRSIPTIILFDNGKKALRLSGLQDKGDLKKLIDDYLRSARK